MPTKSIQKRGSKRIESSLVVKFVYKGSVYYGIAVNLSERGMCINSGNCLPGGADAQLLIPVKDSHIRLPARVRWVDKTCDFYDIMGVEITSPSKKYINFVSTLI